jgi:hypothetical protein
MPRRALSGEADHEYRTTSSAALRMREEGPVMIARRSKSIFTPSDVREVRRRFHDIVRKAAQHAAATSKQAARPLKPSGFSISRQRKTA